MMTLYMIMTCSIGCASLQGITSHAYCHIFVCMCAWPAGVVVPYKIGTMIEVPRGALMAGSLATTAEFFSFGTNDLTQVSIT